MKRVSEPSAIDIEFDPNRLTWDEVAEGWLQPSAAPIVPIRWSATTDSSAVPAITEDY